MMGKGGFPMCKPMFGGFLLLAMGCSADAFDGPDADQAFREPPKLARLRDDAATQGDAAAADAAPEADAGCSVAIDPSPYCAGACATSDGGITCGNATNGPCVAAQGFYGECSSADDCAQGKICALANVADVTGTCPAKLGSAGSGVTLSCADPSYLSIVKSSRPICRTDAYCAAYGFAACVGAVIVGYPALAGETVGVCQ